MNSDLTSVFEGTPVHLSEAFRHFVAGLTDSAVAVFSGTGAPTAISTFRPPRAETAETRPIDHTRVSCLTGSIRKLRFSQIRRLPLTPADLTALEILHRSERSGARRWRGYRIRLAPSASDRIALALEPEINEDLTKKFLFRIWPLLREECSRDVADTSQVDAAWTLLDRIDVAVIILDEKALMYRLNTAARRLLADGKVVRRGRGGLFAANDADTRSLREAISRVAQSGESASEVTFLADIHDGRTVPVTLARYYHEGQPTQFVSATVPVPPQQQRVEATARGLGLTGTEARVAALVQLGLTNREAAEISGLKEQTFNTYVKRALSKLDVKSRSEMAQLLTWQSIGGGGP